MTQSDLAPIWRRKDHLLPFRYRSLAAKMSGADHKSTGSTWQIFVFEGSVVVVFWHVCNKKQLIFFGMQSGEMFFLAKNLLTKMIKSVR